MRLLLPIALALALSPARLLCQDSSAAGTLLRGDRAEISITVKDSAGAIISAPATVKLVRSGGTPVGQTAAAQGRAFFVIPSLGEYTLIVQAAGYQTTQKDVSVLAAVKMETDVYLRRDSESDVKPVHTGPLLAPKAKEAFDKALQALSENKLDAAEKHLAEAAKLAPSHPDVLYVQGVLDLRERKWAEAQKVLEKATQLDPNHSRALAALGMALANQGKYEPAISPLEKALQLDANAGFEARWALAKSYYYQGQYEQALQSSQQALTESNGKAPEIALLVAQSLTAVGRYDDAGQSLREFLKNHGDSPQAATAKRWLDRLAADGKIHKP
jgi:Flp pilus assembly protein TadD